MSHRPHKHKVHQHHHVQHSTQHAKLRTQRSAALLMALFIGLLAFAIAAISSGFVLSWTVGSTIIGVAAGALIGHGIDKAAARKSAR